MVKRLKVAFNYLFDAITVRTQLAVPMVDRKAYERAQKEAYQRHIGTLSKEEWNAEAARLMQSYAEVIAWRFPNQCFKSHNKIDNESRKGGPRVRRERIPKGKTQQKWKFWVEQTPISQSGSDERSVERRRFPSLRAENASRLPSIQSDDAQSSQEYKILFEGSMEMEAVGQTTENV